MTPSPKLFELIKSLNGSEKRYFLKFSSQYKKGRVNNGVKLFKAIASMEEFDEEHLVYLLKKEAFIKNLPSEKNYLYQSILDSLYHYTSGSVQFENAKQLAYIKILNGRGLQGHLNKYMQKLMDDAYMNEDFNTLLELLTIKRNSIAEKGDFKLNNTILKEKEVVLAHLNNLTSYELLEGEVVGLSWQGKNKLIKAHKISQNYFFKNKKLASSIKAKILFNKIHAAYEMVVDNNPEKALNSFKQNIVILEERLSIHSSISWLSIYIVNLHNAVHTAIRANEKAEAKFVLKKLKEMQNEYATFFTSTLRVNALSFYYRDYLNYHIHFNDLKNIKGLTEEIEVFLNRNPNSIQEASHVLLRFYSSYLLFIAGDYKKSISHLLKIINGDTNILPVFEIAAKLLYMMVLYDKNDTFYLKSFAKKMKLNNKYRHGISLTEQRILNFFIHCNCDVTEDKIMFESLRVDLLNLKKTEKEDQLITYTGSIHWCASKLADSTMAKVLGDLSA